MRQSRKLLYDPSRDDEALSKLFCLVRQQIEVFEATVEDIKKRAPRGGSREHVEVGTVGIRCIHCTNENKGKRARGAVSYPRSIRLVYQSVRNWQRHHMLACSAMPPDIKAQYERLKQGNCQKRAGSEGSSYWEESCRRLGMYDTERGMIRLRRREGWNNREEKQEEDCFTENSQGVIPPRLSVNSSSQPTLREQNAFDELFIREHNIFGGSLLTPPPTPPVHNEKTQSQAGNEDETSCLSPADLSVFAAGVSGANDDTDLKWHPSSPNAKEGGGHNIDPGRVTIHGRHCSHMHRSHNSAVSLRKSLSTSEQVRSSVSFSEEIHSFPDSEGPALSVNEPEEVSSSISETPAIRYFATQSNRQGSPPDNPQESILIDQIEAGPLVAFSMTNEVLLGKIELARSMVMAVGRMRHLPPASLLPSDVILPKHDGPVQQEEEVGMLRSLGAEFYELFSGQSFHGCDQCQNDEDLPDDGSVDESQRRQKRERRRDSPSRQLSLSELGLPMPLCSLVSSLLGQCNHSESEGGVTLAEAEEDLQLMATLPDKFLFTENGTGCLKIVPGTLYGREEETRCLLDTYKRVTNASSNKRELVLVSGYSGTGKSVLVSQSFVGKVPCFVTGKFDAMKQLRPLSAFVSALDDYCGYLARDLERIDSVRKAVTTAIGEEVQFLANLVPNFRSIVNVGIDPKVQINGREALRRLVFHFRMLLRATCSHTNPVVICLDDLQWSDEQSLQMMQALVMDSEIQGLLFVGCYRDNEVSTDHPLTMHIENIRRSHVHITSIHVKNMESESITSLVSSVLHITPRNVRPLAEVIMSKTGGNALFTVQFLMTLYDEGLLRFSLVSKRWLWDIDQIRDRDIADNVVELMTVKLLRLAPEVHEALRTAAAFGAQSNEGLFQILDKEFSQSLNEPTVDSLDVAVAEGLLVKTGSVYRFSHDHIQQAAYLLIPESERESFHLKIGRSLRTHASGEELDRYLFVIVDQLHRGSGLISHDKERIDLAELSLRAGQTSFTMSSFLPAAAFLKAGVDLLTEEDWELHHSFCLQSYSICAETEYILGDFDSLAMHIEEALRRAKTVNEKLQPYLTLVQSLGAQQNRVNDAIDTTMSVLDSLGESFPTVVKVSRVKEEIETTQNLVATKSETEFAQMTTSMAFEQHMVMKFLQNLIYWCFVERKEYFPLVACRMVRLSLVHGICPESALGFASYGITLCGLGDFSRGYELGQIALRTSEKFQDFRARVYVLTYGVICPWKEPIQATLPCLKHAIVVGKRTGDTEYAMLAAHFYTTAALFSGQELGSLSVEMQKYSKQMLEYKQYFTYATNAFARQAALNLLGESADPTELVDSEESSALVREQDSVQLCIRDTYHIWLLYLFEKYDQAWKASIKSSNVEKQLNAIFPTLCNHTFYSGLTALVLARREGRATYISCINKAIAKMETWAASMPWNCQHKLELLNAELAYLEGDVDLAAQKYDIAIDLAAKRSFPNVQGLSLEKAGIFFLETGNKTVASEYFRRACDCYTQWGAKSKVAFIRSQYI